MLSEAVKNQMSGKDRRNEQLLQTASLKIEPVNNQFIRDETEVEYFMNRVIKKPVGKGGRTCTIKEQLAAAVKREFELLKASEARGENVELYMESFDFNSTAQRRQSELSKASEARAENIVLSMDFYDFNFTALPVEPEILYSPRRLDTCCADGLEDHLQSRGFVDQNPTPWTSDGSRVVGTSEADGQKSEAAEPKISYDMKKDYEGTPNDRHDWFVKRAKAAGMAFRMGRGEITKNLKEIEGEDEKYEVAWLVVSFCRENIHLQG